jgi:tetratricopeptide (TPR) repeat protein
MTNKPDFIVDPNGNVQDVRSQKNASTSQPFSSQNSRAGVSSVAGLQGTGRSTPGTQRTPGGVTIIPIGLILTLILSICRMLGGASVQNRYSEAQVNSLNWGLSYYDEGSYQEAIRQFDMTIASAPDMSEAYNDRGLAYFAIGENDKALADFDKAIELMPNSGVSYSNRGCVYFSLGNQEQAIADLNKAIELSPQLAKAYHNRGLVYLSLGEADKAVGDFDQAIEFTPEYMFAAQATMESRVPTRESLLGAGAWSSLMDQQTYADLPKTYAGRAMAYLQKGDYERAQADMEKAMALGLDPGFASQIEAQIPIILVVPQPGHWEGIAYQAGYQGNVSFDVGQDGQIHDFRLDLIFGPDNFCQVTSDGIFVQPDGTFSFTFGAPSSNTGNLVEGKFETSTAITGEFNRHVECLSTSGDYIDGELANGAFWKAEWTTNQREISSERPRSRWE